MLQSLSSLIDDAHPRYEGWWRWLYIDGIRPVVSCLLFGAAFVMSAPKIAQAHDVRIGVLAKRGTEQTKAQWSPMANYLSQSIPGEHFVIAPLDFSDIQTAAAQGTIDFILANPYIYVNLVQHHLATAIATMKNLRLGKGYTQFGSVIFTRSDRSDLRDLSDLKGSTFMAVDKRSLGGYLMARLAFKHKGIDLSQDMKYLRFGGTHDAVVYAVHDGVVDAGTVRTDTLERMAAEGRISLNDFRVLNPHHDAEFPFVHSTPLYPEWPFARLKHTDNALARRVAVVLLTMSPDSPAARAAQIAGWTAPLDYKPVHDLLKELRLYPYHTDTFLDLIRKFWREPLFLALLLLTLTAAVLYTQSVNRRLERSHRKLTKVMHARMLAEAALAKERNDLKHKAEERRKALERLALVDSLTGLPNRTLFYDRLDQAVITGRREDKPFAVLMIDLDHFKEINDTLGHYYGDMVLQKVAERLRRTLRGSETVARWGGDEFVVLLRSAGRDHADTVAKKIVENLEQPFLLEGMFFEAGASIGIAIHPEHGTDGDTLMRHADIAMYASKRARVGYTFYEPHLNRRSLNRLTLATELRQALHRDELVTYYQPIISATDGRVCGVETLVRWHHPEQGLIYPDMFIPLAEQTGLIRPLTLWVLNAALAQCTEWRRQGLKPRIAVNLSVWNLQDAHFVAQTHELLDAWDLPHTCLEFEITESAIMADPDKGTEILSQLKERGSGIAVDDFGTGYSSLSYLKQLPIDKLKIDKSFVMGMSVNKDDMAIVRTIINLAHNLDLTVVAEGVENQALQDLLSELGCNQLQGYHISRPMAAEDMTTWLHRRSLMARNQA